MSAVAQPRSGVTVRRRVVDWVPAIVVFFAAIAVWQISIDVFNIQKFLLPKPWAIVSSFWTQRSLLWSAGWLTLKEALGGFVIGSSLGILSAVVLARFRRLGEALMPLAIAANAIPIIAFAPIFNAWFDPLSPAPRIATAAVLCFFPVMVNTLRGLTSVRPSQIELMRSYAAGRVRDLPPCARADSAAVRLRGIESRDRPRDDRRNRERLLRNIRLAGDHHQELRLALRLRDGVGGDPDGQHPRRPPVPRRRNRRTIRPPVGSNPSGKGHCMKGKTLLALLALVIAAAAATAAFSMSRADATPKLTKVTLQLKWVTQAQFAGYYAAVEKGYYKKLGLDVKLKVGGPDITPEQVVLSGQAQFGLDWLPNLFATREKGGKIVSIAQIFARSGMTELTWKDSGLNTIAKLKGKKVGVWCCGNQPELFAALTKNGINPAKSSDVTIVNQPFDMNLFLQRKVDAAAAMTYNELAQVLETKNPKTGQLYKLSDLNVFKMASPAVGTGMLEDNIFTTEKYLKTPSNKTTIVNFLKASMQGWIYCRDHVQDCTNIVLKNGTALGHGHQLWQMNEINKLVWPNSYGVGHVSKKQLANTANIAKTYGVTKKLPQGAVTYSLADQALNQLKQANVDIYGSSYKPITVKVTEGGK